MTELPCAGSRRSGLSTVSDVIDSGGGFNVYWRLDEEYEAADQIEAINVQIRDFCYADDCFNIDRIMRLPGTVNCLRKDKSVRAAGGSLTTMGTWRWARLCLAWLWS